MHQYALCSVDPKLLTRVLFVVLFLAAYGNATDSNEANAQNTESTNKTEENSPWLAGFDNHVEKVMQEWRIPGAAIGIIRDGKIVYVKAFGQRDIRDNLPVTKNTLFPIGSITKSFTATGLAMLSDEGKLEWDKPIKHYLPEFQLHDEMASSRANVVDLLAHRLGIPGQEMSWRGTKDWLDANLSRRDIMRSLAHIKPRHGFRNTYEYSNETYATAGLLFETLANQTWEEFTQSRILDRLEMNSTYLHVRDAPASSDIARGHYYVHLDDRLERADSYKGRAIGPAGTMLSNVPDMLKWVLFHLNRGRHGQETLLSPDSADRLIFPQVPLPDSNPANHIGGFYGMGFMVFAESGRKKWVQHAGSLSNCVSLMGFVPARRDGYVILTNWTDGLGYLPLQAIGSDLTNRMFGREVKNLVAQFRSIDDAQWDELKALRQSYQDRVQSGTTASHDLQSYVGIYDNPVFQSVEISQAEDRLGLSFHGSYSVLEHRQYDIFRTKLGPARYVVIFRSDRHGKINRVIMDLGPDGTEVEFVRRSSKAETPPTNGGR